MKCRKCNSSNVEVCMGWELCKDCAYCYHIETQQSPDDQEESKKKETTRYVWMTHEWKFSDSWDQEMHDRCNFKEEDLELAREQGWRLIKYTCITHPEFEFSKTMKIK